MKKSRSTKAVAYPLTLRLKAVRLYLEEEYPVSLIAEEMGITKNTIRRWVKNYREYGEIGLQPQTKNNNRNKALSRSVKGRIIEVKKRNPVYGSKRISDILKRFFCISASPKSVAKTLHEEGLVEKQKRIRKNTSKPRFFERSTPNQLWQSDIMMFRLGGHSAYLIGFIDDYSRYITGLGLYWSQTAENLIETYRRAISEYGVPREMLTDQGRQYVSWRGRTNFQRELEKDKVSHLKSRPHHPMTLGKIERFWRSIQQEFLFRAKFDTFEEARDRINLWVKYYNHKRPHQGIGSLCPADRYFEINHTLKKELSRKVEENAVELALRGRPADPFYLVGRMGDESVVIRAEKGKVRMLVDGDEREDKELVYRVAKEDSNHENQENQTEIYRDRENTDRAFGLERTPDHRGSVQPHADQPGTIREMAGSCPGGNDQCIGFKESGREQTCPESTHGEVVKQEEGRFGYIPEAGRTPGEAPAEKGIIRREIAYGQKEKQSYPETGALSSGSDITGADRPDHRQRSSQDLTGIPENVLQMGTESFGRDDRGAGRSQEWPSGETEGPGERAVDTESASAGKGTDPFGEQTEDTGKSEEVGPEDGKDWNNGEKKIDTENRWLE